ncbi:Gfo/Idh/MocA family protein [Roseiconus lacunae]|uniref:Gfo/Idh/MocA family protein n=1 Tax=Roseiconus lacunae TaxID=2605694 RepID=UPI001E391AAF|nr:Gfo/Idh/MocA family oxidoreductase [Roseiconus lacunae]MCD0460491.1 Gfo/Idh/MocA family oxidoreductase [Roseiconus lacunae]
MKRRFFLATSIGLSLTGLTLADDSGSDRRRVAIIGHTGRGNFGHGLDTVWTLLPETKIVGVADANPKGLASAQQRLKTGHGYADYRTMLKEVRPEFVSVAPRHADQHHDMIIAAIESGAKGIYVEKPICRSLAELDAIVQAADQREVKIAVAHRNRYHPVMPVIKQLLDDGQLGKLLEIRGRGKGDRRGGIEDLWVLGSHEFNLMHYFAGQPVSCSATILQDDRPVVAANVIDGNEGLGPMAGNRVHATYIMENGVMARYDSIANDQTSKSYCMQLVGSKGIITIHIDMTPVAHFTPGDPYQVPEKPRPWIPITTAGIGQPESNPQAVRDVHRHITAVRDLIDAVDHRRAPLCSIRDAGVTIEMIAAVFESHRRSGQVTTFPLEERENALAKLSR